MALYNPVNDPEGNNNLATKHPRGVVMLEKQMLFHIARRTKATGLLNPILHQEGWHWHEGVGYFKSSQHAYDTLHIGDPEAARKLEAKSR